MKYEFTATHGVEFGAVDEESGLYVAWAKFEHDPALNTPEGEVRYSFATDDAKVAERVRKAEGYGITEAKAKPASKPAADKAE